MALDELIFKKSFRTLMEISELEEQKQNEEAELISTEEKNVKQMNNLCSTLKTEFEEGMDKINKEHDAIAWLKVRIICITFPLHLSFSG
jgi:hypothetical protein